MMLQRDVLLLYGKNEKLLKTLKDILTDFDIYVVTEKEELFFVFETTLPDYVVIALDEELKYDKDLMDTMKELKKKHGQTQIILSQGKDGVKNLKTKAFNILVDIEKEIERVSNRYLHNKLYRLELEIASLREQQVLLTSQVEQLKIEIANSSVNLKNFISKLTKGGLLSYNLVNVLIIILSAIKSTGGTFIQYIINNPIPFSIVTFGLTLTLFFMIPFIIKKFTKKENKNYLYEFKGINKAVYRELRQNAKKRGKLKNRFI